MTRKRNRNLNACQRGWLPVVIMLTPLALAEGAEAACSPISPVNDSIVTCTGTTDRQNDPNGFGAAADTGNTINVLGGAVVTGTQFGIEAALTTINNDGRIESTNALGAAVHAGAAGVNNNNGVITSPSFGVQTSGLASINNSGTIESTARIAIFAGSANIDNSGTIQAHAGQSALSTPGTATVKNSGLFVGGSNAIFSSGGVVEVTDNTGTIRAIDSNGRAINAATVAAVTNSAGGVIEANGADGKAIQAGALAAVTNSGLIQGLGITGNAIIGATVDVTNFGTIQAPNNVAISSGIDDMAITNFGAIIGGAAAASAAGTLDVFNAATGTLSATSASTQSTFTISGFDVLLKNAGLIETSGSANMNVAIFAPNNATIENSGNIRASGTSSAGVVSVGGTADVRNSGFIQQQGDGGAGIVGGEIANVNNSGLIQATGANVIAIFSPGLATGGSARVSNSGDISATGVGGVAISAGIVGGNNGSVVTVNNLSTGVISADTQAIVSNTGSAIVINAGTIQTTGNNSRAINISTTATVRNSGTIQSPGTGSAAIFGNGMITVTNSRSGLISGGALGNASALNEVKLENAGTIETTSVFGGIAIQAATIATVDNLSTGTIRASGDGTAIAANIANVTNAGLVIGGFFGIDAASVNLINTGTISSDTGIRASGLNNVGSTITNSGAIAGTGGIAIKLSPAADTLTLLPGSQIIGAIDMGGGADTINIANNTPVFSRVSSFFKLLSANALNLINFTGTINTAVVTVNTGGMPFVQTADGIATLDPTAFGQADRTLMDFTGGISSLVQGRLGGTAANVSAMQVVSFAPTSASGRTNEAFAAISAMAYGPQHGAAVAGGRAWSSADSPYNVWASGFGGARGQKGDNLMLRSTSSAWGAAIGLDRQVRSDLLLGAFIGGGAGRLSTELNSQSIDTDYFGGGIYGRFDWSSYFLDFTVQAGATHNKSSRLVLDNLTPGGGETATASYNGWYVSPEVAFGRRYAFDHGYSLTPVVRLRYLTGAFDGYSETGSMQNLSVGRRTLQDIEERAEIELAKITGVTTGTLKTSVHGGLIALQRLGSPIVNTVLIGQDLSFTAPGKDSAAGVVAGVGFDLRAAQNVSLFGAFETTVMSDRSRTAAAKGGLRVMF
jgi:autotransporter-like protein